MSPLSFACAAGILGASCAALGAAPSEDPLAVYRWKSRVIVALAPSATDSNLDRQRRLYHDMGHGARERDLVLVEALGSSPAAATLRRRFDAGAGFTALLIGKDGGEKLRSDSPVGPADLFPLIDAMPMRQEEMGKD